MTAIEFYDRTPIENIISTLTTTPDKIIFIGDGKLMGKFNEIHQEFLEKRGLNIELVYRKINRNDVNQIVRVLSEIVESEAECVFDLTGGEDLVLVSMGIVSQKYAKKNIQMQRFNVRNGVVTDCDSDGTVFYNGYPEIKVEEQILVHGGVVRYEGEGEAKTYRWDLSEDFTHDVETMWNICRKNPGLWNSQLNILNMLERFSGVKENLEVEANFSLFQEHLCVLGVKEVDVKGLLQKLNKNGLIRYYRDQENLLSFVYKNEQVRKCLSKAGQVLELKVLVTALKVQQKDETLYYTDAMSGVYIDWDGKLHTISDEEKDTANEIDVILMKGLVPVFVSCKNGQVDDDELYKLDAVTNRFGGIYAKKVLIATYLGKKPTSMEYFRQRAKDMKIHLVEDVHKLNDDQFERMIKHLIDIG